jgi:hypothetical protein
MAGAERPSLEDSIARDALQDFLKGFFGYAVPACLLTGSVGDNLRR